MLPIATVAESDVSESGATAGRVTAEMVRLLPVLILCVAGILSIYSVCVPMDGLPERLYWRRQCAFLFLGLSVYIAIAKARLPVARRWIIAAVYGIFCLVLPLAVLLFGHSTGNGLRWLSLGGLISVQPAEFAKIALLLSLAELVHVPPGTPPAVMVRRYFLALGAVILPLILICLERSFGNTGLLLLIAGTVIVTRWFSWPSIAVFVATIGLVAALCLAQVFSLHHPELALNREKLQECYGSSRVAEASIGLNEKEVSRMVLSTRVDGLLSHCPSRLFCYLSQRGGWNARHALQCIRMGGWHGEGWRHGPVFILGFLPRPVQHTDFAYCVFSEMFGVLGGALILGSMAALIVVVLRQGYFSPSPAGWSFSLGFAALIFAQTVIHVGMALRVLPIIGIPLPFFSYGGSVLISMFAGLGLLARYHDGVDEAGSQEDESGGVPSKKENRPRSIPRTQPELLPPT